MTVEEQSARGEWQHEGVNYYFCCPGCATKFSTNPSAFLNTREFVEVTLTFGAGKRSAQGESEVGFIDKTNDVRKAKADVASPSDSNVSNTYTCPMHSDVTSSGPGDCPACGMPLEASMPGAGDDGKAEIQESLKRLGLSAVLAVPVAFLNMAEMSAHGMQVSAVAGLSVLQNGWLQLALSTPVVLWAAKPFFERGWSSVRNRSLNMFTLLSLGIGLPYIYSLSLLIWLTCRSFALVEQPVYFESAVVIASLAWFGQFLEARARVRSSSAVRELVALMPTEATALLSDGSEKNVSIKDIAIDAKLRVKPGERIPVDGVTIDGGSSVDESMFSGEAMPVFKEIGSKVCAGSINGNGTLVVQAKQLGSDTRLAQIVDMVSRAQRSRMPVQQLADRVASVFVPTVLVIAILTPLAWCATGGGLTHGLSAALAVLVVACPCALGLATPMSIVVAAGRAAKAGILFKEARSLQLLASVTTVVLDKTGTLTAGIPRLVNTHLKGGMNADELLALVASVESRSEHPLASAVMAASAKLLIPPCQQFTSTPGGGVTGSVASRKVVVGTPAFLRKMGVDGSDDLQEKASADFLTAVFVAVDGKCEARIDFADELRPGAADSVRELVQQGIKVVMATGDSKEIAKKVAAVVGITEYHFRLLPGDKADLVRKLQEDGVKVAMIGDGINDAPALVQADVGISMASGTDIAVHSSDIVLVNSDIRGILKARQISRAMLRNIKQNLVLAFSYNMLAIPVATGLLVPVFGFALDPMLAAGAMSLSSVAVIANALRLRGLKL
jgi:Cu+-exporting ATPase